MKLRATTLLLSLSVSCGQDLFLQKAEEVPTNEDVEVIIIGAGWAGMAAADQLARANVSFVVLEASDHTGGRTHAFEFGHSSVGKFIFEQGSNWVQGAGDTSARGNKPSVLINPVAQLALQEGLVTALIEGSTDGNMSNYYKVYDEYGHDADPDGELRAKATAAIDCLNISGAKASATETVRHGLKKCGWSPTTNSEWAMDWMIASDEAGVRPKHRALAGFLPDPTYDWWGPDDWFVVDQHPRGFARLIDGMVKDTVPSGDARVVLNAHVKKIKWSSDGVAISTKDGRKFKGKHAISTVSIGVLRKHHEEMFSPSLPSKQAKALASNHFPMGNLTHVLIQFPSVWWNNSLPAWVSANAGGEANQGKFTAWHNQNHETIVPGSQTLLSFLGEPEASTYGLLNEADLMVVLMERLRAQNPDRDIPDAVAAFIKNWGNDPLTYGAYAYAEPGISWKTTWRKPLKVNKQSVVQFSGEATCSNMNGYTHGALQAGREAAASYLYDAGKGPNPADDDALSLCVWYDYYN